ncbi:MAG: hypothetical protein FWG63_01675 [Defluviitaleaceae bacterium]|nr:hypothetical protein [Defluviitaleaceae bacterium]
MKKEPLLNIVFSDRVSTWIILSMFATMIIPQIIAFFTANPLQSALMTLSAYATSLGGLYVASGFAFWVKTGRIKIKNVLLFKISFCSAVIFIVLMIFMLVITTINLFWYV